MRDLWKVGSIKDKFIQYISIISMEVPELQLHYQPVNCC